VKKGVVTMRTWRWLLALALPLVLAACASTTAQPRPGTGTASTVAGGHQGASAVRHVWVIELENQGPSAPRLRTRTWPGRCRGWARCWKTTTR